MNKAIAERLEKIQRGEIPEGYKKFKREIIASEWNIYSVGQVMDTRNNLRVPISEKERKKIRGHYPYYGPTKVQDYINTYNIEGEHVLIGEDGDHFLKYKEKEMTLLVDGKYNVNNHAHVLRGTNRCMTKWFYYFFQYRNILDSVTRQGVGRYKLTKDALQDIEIYLPDIVEQEKIVNIISTWDKAIELKQQLLLEKQKQKQALANKILVVTKKDKSTSLKIGCLIKESKEKSIVTNQYDILSVTKEGIFLQSEYFNRQIASEDNTGYRVVRKNNLVFSTMNLWMGSIDVLREYEVGIVSPACKVFEINEELVDIAYMKHFVKSDYMMNIYKLNSKQGASIVRRSLDIQGLLSYKVTIPTISEQKRIGMILDTFSQEINLLQQEIQALKKQKQGLMQLLLTGIIRVDEE